MKIPFIVALLSVASTAAAQPSLPPPCETAAFTAYVNCAKAEARRLEPSGESAGDIADASVAQCHHVGENALLRCPGQDITASQQLLEGETTLVRGQALQTVIEQRLSHRHPTT